MDRRLRLVDLAAEREGVEDCPRTLAARSLFAHSKRQSRRSTPRSIWLLTMMTSENGKTFQRVLENQLIGRIWNKFLNWSLFGLFQIESRFTLEKGSSLKVPLKKKLFEIYLLKNFLFSQRVLIWKKKRSPQKYSPQTPRRNSDFKTSMKPIRKRFFLYFCIFTFFNTNYSKLEFTLAISPILYQQMQFMFVFTFVSVNHLITASWLLVHYDTQEMSFNSKTAISWNWKPSLKKSSKTSLDILHSRNFTAHSCVLTHSRIELIFAWTTQTAHFSTNKPIDSLIKKCLYWFSSHKIPLILP